MGNVRNINRLLWKCLTSGQIWSPIKIGRMSYVLEKVSIDSYYGNLLLGMFEFLERNRRVKNVNLRRTQGLKSQDVTNWEHTNGVKLPDDLKSFYLASNGFLLTWEYNFGGETLPAGSINVVHLEEMILLTGYSCATKAKVQVFGSQYFLQLDENSKVGFSAGA